MINIKELKNGGMPSTDIALTRGDSATLVLPVYQTNANGTRTAYFVTNSDTVEVQVREKAISNNVVTPSVVINGTVTVNTGVPSWTISHTDSTIDAAEYVWDAQITVSGGEVYTFYSGKFTILPEVTI